MSRPLSPAQIANQVTFVLKGHLKNVRLAYIRAASLLARVRDEKLWQALKFRSLEEYAVKRLGLQSTALYRYLQVYDWLRDFHRGWLVRRPKGFIPELSDAYALMWIENRLRDPHLADAFRRELEALRRKGLEGQLTEREFRELKNRGRQHASSLRTFLARLRALRRVASGIAKVPAAAIDGLDSAIGATEAALDATNKVVRLSGIGVRIPRGRSRARGRMRRTGSD